MSIVNKAARLKDQMETVCKQSQREMQDITLVAVTKTVDIPRTKEVIQAGIIHLGENRPEPFLEKVKALEGEKIYWHYIGSLQTRKVKAVISHIDYLHSLDRISLAKEIEKRAEKPVKCFVQVKTSPEESKHGLMPEETLAFIKALEEYKKINVIGLMTMAPYTADKKSVRSCFQKLKKLQEEIQSHCFQHATCTELSMGMSNDFDVAIEEGATFIRIGSSLVGE